MHMKPNHIRPIAICLFRHAGRILVSEGYDTSKQAYYARPLGGGIEFGETSRAAVTREIAEELSARVERLQLLGVLENIFNYEGQPGHEIVFVYDAELADQALYERAELPIQEECVAEHLAARWRTPAELAQANIRLVPEGLLDLIANIE
ncbi:MAG TPA: NUDIX hydrolase [Pyrinomonadaceae bacterium]